MTLALFDLDHTIINGDSEVLWGEFLGERGLVKAEEYRRQACHFFDLYKSGRLNISDFLDFQLQFLSQHDMDTLTGLRSQFVSEKIVPTLLPKAQDLIASHRAQRHRTMIITASSEFVAQPIAEIYGVDVLIATKPEIVNGRYTGRARGIPSFAAGKVTRLQQWIQSNGESLAGSWFYSDSHNDLPLMRTVDNPVAVHPDPTLADEAARAGWPVISLL